MAEQIQTSNVKVSSVTRNTLSTSWCQEHPLLVSADRRGQVVGNPASCFDGTVFESWSGDRMSSLLPLNPFMHTLGDDRCHIK